MRANEWRERSEGWVNPPLLAVRDLIGDLKAEESRSDMCADLCRGVAEAIGVPKEGEGSSWHDLPEKVQAKLAPAVPDALREAPSSEESLARLTFNSDGEEIGREMAKRIIAAMRNDYHLLYTMLHPNAFAVLVRPASAAPDGLRDFEAGRVKIDMDGPYSGWVSVRHADGQWVTAAKLEPFSMAILSQPLSGSPRKEGE